MPPDEDVASHSVVRDPIFVGRPSWNIPQPPGLGTALSFWMNLVIGASQRVSTLTGISSPDEIELEQRYSLNTEPIDLDE